MNARGESQKEASNKISQSNVSKTRNTGKARNIAPLFITVEDIASNRRKPPIKLTKTTLHFATWNVTSLVSNSSKLYQLTKTLNEYKLDICGLTETHMPTSGETFLDNGFVLLNSGSGKNKVNGVGLVIAQRVKTSLISYTPWSDRIISARFFGKKVNITCVVAYAPTEVSQTGVKDKFYRDLHSVQKQLPQNDVHILLGDFNARVGSDTDAWKDVIGKHSLHQIANENGTRLLEFCALNEYVIGGTLFAHKDIHKVTWTSPKGDTHTQIDHVCINKRWKRSLLDVRGFRGADINSTHNLVRAKFTLKLSSKRKEKMVPQPNIELLRSGLKLKEYQESLKEKPINIDKDTSLEDDWNAVVSLFQDVSFNVLGKMAPKPKDKRLSKETTELIEKRNNLKKQRPTIATRKDYSAMNKKVKNSVKRDDNKWAEDMASKLQSAAAKGNQRDVWSIVNVLSGKNRQKATSAVRDKNGAFITDPEKKLARWKEHFQELGNPLVVNDDISDSTDDASSDVYFPRLPLYPPTKNEILKGLGKLKNYKAAGCDNILNEQLKYGQHATVEILQPVFEKVWNQEKVPEDWLRGIIVKVGKKGDTSICGNNRGITLRCVASKLFQIIVMNRMSDGIETLLRDNQCGFRRNRSCDDQLFALRIIMDRVIEYNLPLVMNFIDFKAAFDCVNRNYIWAAMKHYGIPEKYINIFKSFYINTQCAVKIDKQLTDWFCINSGTGQGDIHSPSIFNIVINWVLERAINEKEISKGLTLQKRLSSRKPAKHVTDADYADDIVVLDDNECGLQETTNKIAELGKEAGLYIGVSKTKCMLVGKFHTQRPYQSHETLQLNVYGEEIDQVNYFIYLGSTIASDGTINKEIDVRIGKASSTLNRLNNIWSNKGIKLKNKICIYESAVLTVLLYGCISWALTKQQLSRLEGFHHTCLRRILKIRWFQYTPNRDIRAISGCKKICGMISAARLRYFGHVARMDATERIQRYLVEWIPRHGRRNAGRPRCSLIQCITEDLRKFTNDPDCTISDGLKLAQNRQFWKEMIRNGINNINSEQADPPSG